MIDLADRVVEAQKKYIEFLGLHIRNYEQTLFARGFVCPKHIQEEGSKLRDRILTATGEYNHAKSNQHKS